MSKPLKITLSVLFCVFTLVILLALTVMVIKRAGHYTFFINETFSFYRISPEFLMWLGIFGDACVILAFCILKKSKAVFRVLTAVVIVVSLFWGVLTLSFQGAVERHFYRETSPDGKDEIIVSSYQFLVACSGDVYYRENPFFIRKLMNEENRHVEWFYDDYTIEWNVDGDGNSYVIIDGYTYLLPEN